MPKNQPPSGSSSKRKPVKKHTSLPGDDERQVQAMVSMAVSEQKARKVMRGAKR